jgi:predicted nuclease of restriction endonuclease-like (RecB) superfamily
VRELDEPPLPDIIVVLPWGHHVTLIEQVKESAARQWYAKSALEHGWARPILIHQIETRLFERQAQAVTNFHRTLPPPQSDLAQQIVKDPYNFDFLALRQEAHERELEAALIDNIRKFLLELGVGFSFVGSQYQLTVGGDDFYIDLLFYHLKLRCFVVIDLKIKEFKPEYAGKLNFYLSAVDDLLRHPTDEPTIGLILCKSNNRIVAEYALRDLNKPMGIATYLTEVLPDKLRDSLPDIEDLEATLSDITDTANDNDTAT